MFHLHHIESFDLPALEPYRTLRRPLEHRAQGIFVAEGEKVTRRLLESSFDVLSVVMPEDWLPEFESLLRDRPENLPVFLLGKKLLEELTGFSFYQGVMGVGRVPAPRSLDEILGGSPRPYLLIALDGIGNAENVGGLVRNCVAFGAHALIVGETSSSPYVRRAVRSSMGAIFHLPVLEVDDLAQTLAQLRRRNIRCVAAHPHATSRFLPEADLTLDCCLVFGSEGQGLSPAVLAGCDPVAIPMRSGVDSLNVGSAGAIFLYEASRQRRGISPI